MPLYKINGAPSGWCFTPNNLLDWLKQITVNADKVNNQIICSTKEVAKKLFQVSKYKPIADEFIKSASSIGHEKFVTFDEKDYQPVS